MHAAIANAQEKKSKWININGGFNVPLIVTQNAYGNPEFEYFPTLGLTGGTGMSYFINADWGFNGSVLVTKLGQNYKGVQSGGDAQRKVKLLYLEVPFTAMKKVINIKTPIWLSFGPDFFYLLDARQEFQRSGGNTLPHPEGMAEGDIKERFNPIDVSLNIAASQFYNLNKLNKANSKMLLVSLNTSWGLTDINRGVWKTPQPDGTYNGSHNFYIGMKVGLMFNTVRENNYNSRF